jgi:cytidine deaminase
MCRCTDVINTIKNHAIRSSMLSKHSAGIYAKGKLLVTDAFNYHTGHALNCHAEQSAIMKMLKLYGTRRPTTLFNFTKPLTESLRRCLLSSYQGPGPTFQNEVICRQGFTK